MLLLCCQRSEHQNFFAVEESPYPNIHKKHTCNTSQCTGHEDFFAFEESPYPNIHTQQTTYVLHVCHTFFAFEESPCIFLYLPPRPPLFTHNIRRMYCTYVIRSLLLRSLHVYSFNPLPAPLSPHTTYVEYKSMYRALRLLCF